jgi:hypothetical protein
MRPEEQVHLESFLMGQLLGCCLTLLVIVLALVIKQRMEDE